MQYSILGSTGMKVSQIALGTATFGVAPAAEQTDRLVAEAMDLGINFIDTADVYGNMPVFDRPGAPPAADREPAEQLIGKAIRGHRDKLVIATKCNGIVGHGVNDRGLSRRHVIRQVETSLRRLETDYIDLYYAHDPDPDTSLEQTLAVYDDLIRQGKIRYVALSNHPAWMVTRALWIADDRRLNAPVAAQVKYNLIERAAERELAPACEQFGLSIIPYAPLHGGLLAGLDVLERDVVGDQRFQGSGFPKSEIAIARELARLSETWGVKPYQVSLAWLLSRTAVASVIVGAETSDELIANTSAVEISLDPTQLDAITALANEPPAFYHRKGDGPERPRAASDPHNSKPPSAVDRTERPLRLMSVPLPLHARSTSSRKTPSRQVNLWLPEIHNSLNIKQYIGWTRVTPIAGHAPRIPGSAVCGPVAHAAAQTLAPSSSAFPNTWTSPGISGANALTACRIHSMSETIAIRSKSLRCISPTRASLQTAPGV